MADTALYFFPFRQTMSVPSKNTGAGDASHPQAGGFAVRWCLLPQVPAADCVTSASRNLNFLQYFINMVFFESLSLLFYHVNTRSIHDPQCNLISDPSVHSVFIKMDLSKKVNTKHADIYMH